MTCTGIVQDGRIVLDGDTALPEGLRVQIIPLEHGNGAGTVDKLTLGEWLEQVDKVRAALPHTSDSTDLLRQLREERADR